MVFEWEDLNFYICLPKMGPWCKRYPHSFPPWYNIELSLSRFCYNHKNCQLENNENWQWHHLYSNYVYHCLAGSFWPYLLCDNFILLVERSHLSLSNIFMIDPKYLRLWCDNLMSWVTFLHVEIIPTFKHFNNHRYPPKATWCLNICNIVLFKHPCPFAMSSAIMFKG